MNVEINRDIFLGFVVQNGIPASSKLRDEVDRRIEQLVQMDDKKPITLAVVLHVLEACRQQLQHENRDNDHHEKHLSVFTAAIDRDTTNDVFPEICYPVKDYLSQINESKWEWAVANYALRAAQCWNCGSSGHVKRNCPKKTTTRYKHDGNQYIVISHLLLFTQTINKFSLFLGPSTHL